MYASDRGKSVDMAVYCFKKLTYISLSSECHHISLLEGLVICGPDLPCNCALKLGSNGVF